ncbi:MAG: ABC transporter permease [Allorhizobium sp.]
MVAYGAYAAPFVTFRANRIVPGEGRFILDALPSGLGMALAIALLGAGLIALFRAPVRLRLSVAAITLCGVAIAVGIAAGHLTPEGDSYARIAPASGFWVLVFAFGLMAADSIARLNPKPFIRVVLLAVALSAVGVLLTCGLWDNLSILKEYSSRADAFWAEALRHVLLAVGSLLVAAVVGLPLGILCHRVDRLRAGVLNVLNLIQTIPSIALFGIMIAPLSWVAIHIPGASALGIRGIGAAPAFVALFLYSLLPVVANTVVGLAGVPRDANEAARGVGMTGAQRLARIELPLALPVILTGIRIVLVQNIGLATIAALIGGGGFGVFVFQGMGQTAMDLVLLGAVPTVVLAFASAIVMDALVDTYAPAGSAGVTR